MGGCSAKQAVLTGPGWERPAPKQAVHTGPAPYLHEYFAMQEKFTKTKIAKDPLLGLTNPGAARDEMKKLYKNLTPIIEKSVNHHDIDRTGVLTVDESKAFFQHFIDEWQQNMEKELRNAVVTQNKMMAGSAKDLPPEMAKVMKDMEKQLQAQIKAQHRMMKERIDKKIAEYKDPANTEKMNMAAFAVIDANSDNKLQKEEVVQALLPATEKHEEFMKVFGLDTATLASEQWEAAMPDMEAAMPPECNQM